MAKSGKNYPVQHKLELRSVYFKYMCTVWILEANNMSTQIQLSSELSLY